MQPMAAPKFEASHRITARVRVPDKGVSGVLVSDGSRAGGFVLYVKDNRLVYENNTTFSHELIVSSQEIPKGEVELAFEFTRTAKPSEGLAKLYINSHIVAEKHIARLGFDTSGGYKMVGSFGVGQSYASSVSTSFESPNKFTGLLHELDIDLK